MLDGTDFDLEAMSLRELLALQNEIHTAVRAVIRQRAEQKAVPTVVTTSRKPIDLEAERDAWLARRRSTT